MKPVLIAPAAFKGSLHSYQVGQILAAELSRRGIPYRMIPIADGGDGTLDALKIAWPRARIRSFRVTGPDGRPVRARVLVLRRRWVVEMAEAAGLRLMRRPDACNSTTFGVGELIRRGSGCEIVVGLGGSATNDAGAGMLEALGARFLDRRGRAIPRGGGALGRLDRIEWPDRPRLRLIALTDVDHSLFGPRGASRTFGRQKGATPDQVRRLEENVRHFARVAERDLGVKLGGIEGGGAAGGLGAALIGILGARRFRGAEFIFRAAGLGSLLRRASAVVTAEGRVDETTFRGKAVGEICRRARAPLYILAGSASRRVPGATMVRVSDVAGSVAESLRDPRRHAARAARILVDRLVARL